MDDSEEISLVFNKRFIFEEPLATPKLAFKLPPLLERHAFTVKRQHRSSVEDKVARIKSEQEPSSVTLDQSDTESSCSEDDTDDGKEDEDFFSPSILSGINSFSDMSLSRPLLKAVNELGFSDPTPIQARAIPLALAGRDLCACAATGSGKTAAFLLPILERLLFKSKDISTIRVLILSPTRELAIQTHTVGTQLCHFSTAITLCLIAGGMDLRAQERSVRNRPDILVATPGRLIDLLHNTPSFDLSSLEVLVLDEADRMLEEHFELELQEILRLCPKHRQTLLFSATMTDEVEQLATLSLRKPIKLFVDKNTDVAANLKQEFVRIRPEHESDREPILLALCKRTFTTRCLIFLPMKQLAHRLHICFSLLGLHAAELHGNLTQAQRVESLERFKKSDVNFLLATDLAARGLDIEGVRTVMNYSMPATLQHYIHRVGRTARAGRSGKAVTLVGESGRKVLKEIVKGKNHKSTKRIVAPSVIEGCKKELERIAKDVERVLEEEKEEKNIASGEMEIKKAENLINHHDEISSRPPRLWFTKKNKTNKKKDGTVNGSSRDKQLQIQQKIANRLAKKAVRPKRLKVHVDEKGRKKKTLKMKSKNIVPSNNNSKKKLNPVNRRSKFPISDSKKRRKKF